MAGPLGWRAAFLLEAAAMAPFVAFCALAPPIHLRGMSKGARHLAPNHDIVGAQFCVSRQIDGSWPLKTILMQMRTLTCNKSWHCIGPILCFRHTYGGWPLEDKTDAEADRSPAAVAADMKGPREWGTGLVGAVKEAASDLVTVCRHPVYVCTIGGQTLYTGMGPASSQLSSATAHGFVHGSDAQDALLVLERLSSLSLGSLSLRGWWMAASHNSRVAVSTDVEAGLCWCVAFIGAIAYLGPKAGRDVFGISGETADLVFGAVTVLTGVFGTLAGGVLLDRMGSTMGNALTICAAGMAIG